MQAGFAAATLLIAVTATRPYVRIAQWRMRELLRTNTERFRRVAVIPIDTNFSNVAGAQIEIFEQSFAQGKIAVGSETL